MLVSLHIQNIGLIDNIEIPFRRGLNVLSGETGAGKSMMIGSLDALLGGEMAKSLKREEDSFIEGVFALEGMSPAIFDCLEELGLSGEQELIISRKVSVGFSLQWPDDNQSGGFRAARQTIGHSFAARASVAFAGEKSYFNA